MTNSVSIKPGVNILGVFRHLNYKAWHALAEFVDNSIQSFLNNRETFNEIGQESVSIDIRFDHTDNKIIIIDNAAGIQLSDFPRAFRPATPPPDRKGLNEYGLGMKTAACWFSPLWRVETSVLNDNVTRTVEFDVEQISAEGSESVPVKDTSKDLKLHGTKVVLEKAYKIPNTTTIVKIRSHLSDIYKIYLSKGLVKITVQGEPLDYQQPDFLKFKYLKDRSESPEIIHWKRDVKIQLGGEKTISGSIGIFEVGSRAKAGLQLFRRGRAIIGTGEDVYKPSEIFGPVNGWKSMRLYAELHLDAFNVTQQKDSFTWIEFPGSETDFINLVKAEFDKEPSFLYQAGYYRAKGRVQADELTTINEITQIADQISQHFPDDADVVIESSRQSHSTPEELPVSVTNEPVAREVLVRGSIWRIKIEKDFTDNPKRIVSVADLDLVSSNEITIRIHMNSKFIINHNLPDGSNLATLLSFAAAIGLVEVLAKKANDYSPAWLINSINHLLNNSFAKDVSSDE